jgi:hypothetical protein
MDANSAVGNVSNLAHDALMRLPVRALHASHGRFRARRTDELANLPATHEESTYLD